jgi:hypothetical protein
MKKQTNNQTNRHKQKQTNTGKKNILAMRVRVGLIRSTKKDNFSPVSE